MEKDTILEQLCQKYGVKLETIEAMVKEEREKQPMQKKRGLPNALREIIEREVKSENASNQDQN